MGKGGFAFNSAAESAHAARHGTRDKDGFAVVTNIRVKGLELPAYARQVRVERFGVDVTGEKHDVEREGIGCRVSGQMMKIAESEV
jgi:hypothetical protein